MTDNTNKKAEKKPTTVDSLYHTAEWLISAFAGTLVFIMFGMQAYTIPTGSMAETLRGAHFRLRCSQCAYPFDYDFRPERYRYPRNSAPGFNVELAPVQSINGRITCPELRCPSCGYFVQSGQRWPVMKGDRIFVLKCIYQFFEPKRWDVVVFKNPLGPYENYIKRLIGRPGEEIELYDGDVYINGRIARKGRDVQEELWMCVYDNDYQPAKPSDMRFNGHKWSLPFRNEQDSRWDFNADGPTVFGLDDQSGKVHTFYYDTGVGNDFRATYAYDDARFYRRMPICSDLMVRFYVRGNGASCSAGAILTKYGQGYRGVVNGSGRMVIEKSGQDNQWQALVSGPTDGFPAGGIKRFSFSNVDHQLILECGKDKLEYNLGEGKDALGEPQEVMPKIAVLGSGKILLSGTGIYRDIHYLSRNYNGVNILQAAQGSSFKLGEDEYFVCGDNSPASFDCRCWDKPGIGNSGLKYRQGIVPRDYLVGKAFFVYWPGPYRPFNGWKIIDELEKGPATRFLKIFFNIPCVGGMKVIHGGED